MVSAYEGAGGFTPIHCNPEGPRWSGMLAARAQRLVFVAQLCDGLEGPRQGLTRGRDVAGELYADRVTTGVVWQGSWLDPAPGRSGLTYG